MLSASRRSHFLRTAEVAWALGPGNCPEAYVYWIGGPGTLPLYPHRGLHVSLGHPRRVASGGRGAWWGPAESRGLVACPSGGVYSSYETGGGPQNIAVHCWGLEHRVN